MLFNWKALICAVGDALGSASPMICACAIFSCLLTLEFASPPRNLQHWVPIIRLHHPDAQNGYTQGNAPGGWAVRSILLTYSKCAFGLSITKFYDHVTFGDLSSLQMTSICWMSVTDLKWVLAVGQRRKLDGSIFQIMSLNWQ